MLDNLRNIMNFDETLFENRNKAYGAYQLRKKYNSVLVASMIAAVLLFSGIIIIPFISRPSEEKIYSAGNGYVTVQMQSIEPPEDLYIPPPAPPPPEERIKEVVTYSPPVVVDSVKDESLYIPTSEEISEMAELDKQDISIFGQGGDPFGIEGGEATDDLFSFVEIMPRFKGGDIEKFREWVIKNTNYPQEAVDRKIRGKVFLTFIVETDGSVSNVTVIKGVDPIIDVEAIKAIESSPKWTPGMQRGKPVRVRYQIPLNFLL